MDRLFEMGSEELVAAYARGELSPVAVAESVYARIDAWEPAINAMYLTKRDAALRSAQHSEQRWRRGAPLSPIDGVPVTIKENIHTEGDPAPIGTAATGAAPQPRDAPPAARLREAGCVIIGKTTMPDFGMLSSGLSSLHGVTRNPWRRSRNTSGSSSGAAAACVAGYGPLHVGTDIGGSVRLPATHGGFFALKPSLGLVPIYPPFMGRVAGPMTRTVRDAAALLTVLAGPDDRDFMSLPYRPIDYRIGVEGLSPKGLRVGVLLDMKAGFAPDPQVVAATEAAAQALRTAGAQVEVIDSFLTSSMLDGIQRFFEARSYNDVQAMDAATRAKVLPFIVEWCSWRARAFSGADVMRAFTEVVAMRDAATQAAARFDFLISPVSPVLPWAAELPSPNDDPHDALPHIAFTVPWSMSEHPAASVNWTVSSDGMPIGVQLIGQRFDDLGVLRLARTIEIMRPDQAAWPEPDEARD